MRAFSMPMPIDGNHQKLDWSEVSWLLLADTSPPPTSSMMLRAKAAKKGRRDSRDGITTAASAASTASTNSPNTTHRHGICYTLWWYFLTRYSALSVWCYQLSRTGLFHSLIVIGVALAMASSMLESHNELYLDRETGTIRMRRARDNEDIVKMTKTLNLIAFVIFSLETLVKVGACVYVCIRVCVCALTHAWVSV